MKLLFVGDIMGSGGRDIFLRVAREWKQSGKADFIVVNGENAAAGKGLTPKLAAEMFSHGADVITLGDHAYDQREIMPYLDETPAIIRPANFSEGCPGRGVTTVSTPKGDLTVISLIGRVFMDPRDCPFKKADAILAQKTKLAKHIFVDFHAEATSEKNAMGRYLDGRVGGVVGTHTHVQTADEKILKGGTAYLTDAGMTGSKDSIIGCETEPIIKRFLTGLPVRFQPAEAMVTLEGALIEMNADGRAVSIQRVQIPDHGG
jgi:2',3'-cyclic-nucleotide 2'-phosphodiesterase